MFHGHKFDHRNVTLELFLLRSVSPVPWTSDSPCPIECSGSMVQSLGIKQPWMLKKHLEERVHGERGPVIPAFQAEPSPIS